MMISGGVKFRGVEFTAAVFMKVNLNNASLNNGGLLGTAARALRDRPKVIERAVRNATGG